MTSHGTLCSSRNQQIVDHMAVIHYASLQHMAHNQFSMKPRNICHTKDKVELREPETEKCAFK